MSSNSSLRKPINTIQQSTLRLRYHHIQGSKIQQRVSSRYENTPQTNGDIPVHLLYNLLPTERKEKQYQRRSSKTLRTKSSNKSFEENITAFKEHLMERGYPQNFINNTLSEVKFQERKQALLQRNKARNESCPS